MKSTGMVRKIDELGRIVIPKEIRRIYGINQKDALEIFVDDDRIILSKYEPACLFCGSADDVKEVKGRLICGSCVSEIAEKAE